MPIGKKARGRELMILQRVLPTSSNISSLIRSRRIPLNKTIKLKNSITSINTTSSIHSRSIRTITTFSMSNGNNLSRSSSDNVGVQRGALIVLEGLDRSGKSSQCSMLHEYLVSHGFRVESWRFPEMNTAVGAMISEYLSNKQDMDDQTVHLLFSANRWERRSLMESKLNSGISLIVDRYSYSGVAFSAAKGLELEWCKAPEEGLVAPDLVFYLDISPEKAAERGGYGGERYEHLDFQKKVAEFYTILSGSSWQNVNASLPKDSIHETLKDLSVKCIECCRKGKKLSHLWL